MQQRYLWIIIFILPISCSTPITPQSNAYYSASIEYSDENLLTLDVNIVTSESPRHFTVLINNKSYDSLRYECNQTLTGLQSRFYFSGFYPSDTLSITIQSDIGKVQGEVIIPDSLYLISSTNLISNTFDSTKDITLSWSKCAEWYSVYMYAPNLKISSIDSILLDTQYVISKRFLTNSRGSVWFGLKGYNGNIPHFNQMPNLTGDGYGFLYASNRVSGNMFKMLNQVVVDSSPLLEPLQ